MPATCKGAQTDATQNYTIGIGIIKLCSTSDNITKTVNVGPWQMYHNNLTSPVKSV